MTWLSYWYSFYWLKHPVAAWLKPLRHGPVCFPPPHQQRYDLLLRTIRDSLEVHYALFNFHFISNSVEAVFAVVILVIDGCDSCFVCVSLRSLRVLASLMRRSRRRRRSRLSTPENVAVRENQEMLFVITVWWLEMDIVHVSLSRIFTGKTGSVERFFGWSGCL